MAVGKKYLLRVYNRSSKLVAIYADVEFNGWEWGMNGGLGEFSVRLPDKIDSFGEGSKIDFKFKVKLYCFDVDTADTGQLVYQGYIARYKQIVQGNTEYVDVFCLGYQTLFERILMKDSSSNTTVAFSGVDPSTIMKSAAEAAAVGITADNTTVQNTGQSVSYTFRANSIKDVLDKAIDLSPAGFFWTTDANNVLRFERPNFDRPDFKLTFGTDFFELEVEKSMEEMTNVFYMIGGGNPNLFRKYNRSGSVTEFGTLEGVKTDERVTLTSTADVLAQSTLDQQDHPRITVRITVSDSNLKNATGVNVEALRPGQVVAIRNIVDEQASLWDVAQWDIDPWDFNIAGALANPLVIKKISYRPDSATLELGDFISTFGQHYLELEDSVETTQYQNLPSAPTAV